MDLLVLELTSLQHWLHCSIFKSRFIPPGLGTSCSSTFLRWTALHSVCAYTSLFIYFLMSHRCQAIIILHWLQISPPGTLSSRIMLRRFKLSILTLLRSTTILGLYDLWPSLHPLNKIIVFRSLYTKLLNNPSTYGFTDVTSSGGSFWIDTIHVRTKVHQYMAADLATFLQNQSASVTNPVTTSTTARTTTSKTTAPVTITTTSSAPASTATGTVPKYGQW